MACHHCGKARRAVVDAVKAVVKGDVDRAAEAAKEAARHMIAKTKGSVVRD